MNTHEHNTQERLYYSFRRKEVSLQESWKTKNTQRSLSNFSQLNDSTKVSLLLHIKITMFCFLRRLGCTSAPRAYSSKFFSISKTVSINPTGKHKVKGKEERSQSLTPPEKQTQEHLYYSFRRKEVSLQESWKTTNTGALYYPFRRKEVSLQESWLCLPSGATRGPEIALLEYTSAYTLDYAFVSYGDRLCLLRRPEYTSAYIPRFCKPEIALPKNILTYSSESNHQSHQFPSPSAHLAGRPWPPFNSSWRTLEKEMLSSPCTVSGPDDQPSEESR